MQTCTSGVVVNTNATVGAPLAASVYLPVAIGATVVVRLKLNNIAPAGYRAGVLVSTASTLAGANLLGNATLRTYLSTVPNAVRDSRVVAGTTLQAQLGEGSGLPQQLELLSTQAFDEVEIEFSAALSAGLVIDVRYAYGVSSNQGAELTGYLSRFDPATTVLSTKYTSGSCANVANPERAVDNDLTNYASFASLVTVNCDGLLRVKLNGTAPAHYWAGFVIGRTNNLLDAGILTNLVVRSYLGGTEVERAGSGASLLGLSVLPDGRALVSFQATQSFDEVSIERTGLVTALDNLQLYFGVGLAAVAVPLPVYSDFANTTGHFQVENNGVACVNCGITNPEYAANASRNDSAMVQKTVAGITSIGLRLDLNGDGLAGNRAGAVLGRSSMLDASALENITLTTYDAAGQVLESATGSPLLTLAVLPNNRRRISFNTTADFSKVRISFGSALSAFDTNNVFYAFADDTDGSFSIRTPTAPLPVTLTSFGVRRPAGAGPVEVSWATASEQNSAYFVVERMAELGAGFQAVGRVAAAGTSSQPRQYRFLDATAGLGTTLYYRLRQVDIDGSTTISPVAVLAAGAAPTEVSLYPNPVAATAGQVTVGGIAALQPGASISVYSGGGQLLYQQQVSASLTDASLMLPTTKLTAGLYLVVVREASGQLLGSRRLEVQ
ncbi:MAG: hypothetical protein ACRYFX_22750 [Janthinobacterium lividum]